jgi:hypothetical protein
MSGYCNSSVPVYFLFIYRCFTYFCVLSLSHSLSLILSLSHSLSLFIGLGPTEHYAQTIQNIYNVTEYHIKVPVL